MQLIALITMAIGLASVTNICRTIDSDYTGNKVCCAGIQVRICCNLGIAKFLGSVWNGLQPRQLGDFQELK